MPKTLDHEIETLAAEQHGLIAHAQAIALGATKEAIRHRRESTRWVVHRPSVYRLPGTPGGWRVDLHAAVLAAGGNAVASHLAAAALHAMPGFPEGALELSVTAVESPDVFGAVVHRKALLPPAHVGQVDNIPVTTAARTLFDLAGTIHPLRTARALDNCLARAMVALPAVQQVFDDLAKRGRTGTALMRELLQARGSGYVAPASDLESSFLRLVKDAGLPLPERESLMSVTQTHGWAASSSCIPGLGSSSRSTAASTTRACSTSRPTRHATTGSWLRAGGFSGSRSSCFASVPRWS